MSMVKLDQVDFSNISVDDPIKQDGLYLSRIQYNKKDLVIQLPKLIVSSLNDTDSLDVIATDELKTFIDKYKTLENEIKMLQEDKKILIEDLKDNHGISPKVIRKAIQVAKIRTAMGDELVQLDNIVEQLEGSIV